MYKLCRVEENGSLVSLLVQQKEFKLSYRKGKITKAPEGSLGIFCFETKEQAKLLKEQLKKIKTKVIEVEPASKRGVKLYKPMCIDRNFVNPKAIPYLVAFPPAGTVCCPSVKVLS